MSSAIQVDPELFGAVCDACSTEVEAPAPVVRRWALAHYLPRVAYVIGQAFLFGYPLGRQRVEVPKR